MLKKYLKGKYRELLAVLADKSVKFAEELDGEGSAKKKAAVDYVLKMLPLNPIIKPLVIYILNEAIDDAVELAVRRLKRV
jgi:hypothetical protein